MLIAIIALAVAKPVAIMIHGAGGGGWEYMQWKPIFEKAGFHVIARDLVPAGGLEKTTLADYVEQVVAWAKAEKGPVILVGASMGGPIALKAAERLKPAGVILINAVPPVGVAPKQEAKPHPAIVRWAGSPRQDSVDAMPDSDAKMIDYAWKRWRDESGAVMDALSSGIACAKPSCPVLVVIGEDDKDISPNTSRAVAAWASADVFTYRGVSHVGPLLGRRAPEIARQVVDWLAARAIGPP